MATAPITIDGNGNLVLPVNASVSVKQIKDVQTIVNLLLVHDSSITDLQRSTALSTLQAVVVDLTNTVTGLKSNYTTLQTQYAALAAQVAAGLSAGGAPAITGPVALTNPTTVPSSWTSLTLTPADDIGKALASAIKGFKLMLSPGTYNQVFNVPVGLDGWTIISTSGKASDVKIDGGGGLTVAQNNTGSGVGRLAWGKGVIHCASPGTIQGIEVTGGGWKATDGHDGQAGVYWECSNGACNIIDCMIRHNQNGVFGNNGNQNVQYLFQNSDFLNNSVDGGSHDSYVNGANSSLTIINCRCEGSNFGNNFKCRVGTVTMQGGFYGSQNANRWIEAADGAVMTITGGLFIANDIGQNLLGNGTESTTVGPGNTTVSGATFWIANRSANFSNAGTFTASNCTWLWEGPNSSVFNDKGTTLNGVPNNSGIFSPAPSLPPHVSAAA